MKTCPICENSWPSQHTTCPTDGALLIDSRELEPGTVIRGKYRIMRQLGRGGMGTVYLAEHILLGRPRALKFISSELSQDATFLRRFRREAQAAIELRHPNVVEVVDLDQAEDGSPYIAMEYVEGPDLRHALESGVFSVERAVAIARGIALGLGTAHAKGIIHRDVKPENILIAGGEGKPETPKLLDFGIAAMKESATVSSRTHGLLLTPPYAAPEQWKGMAAEELDGRADLYALGGVFYEMLTGHTAFHAHNTEGWMYQHLHEQPQLPSLLRPELANWQGLDALVLRLLAKDREQRPRDAGELVGLLDSLHPSASEPRRETVREVVAAEAARTPTVELPDQVTPAEMESTAQDAANADNKGTANKEFWANTGVRISLIAGIVLIVIVLVIYSMNKSSQPSGPASQTSPTAQSPSPYAEIENKAEELFAKSRYTEARPLFEQACNGGNGNACNHLGILYLDGFGVKKNSETATGYYAKACDAGDATGCVNLAGCYRDGVGVTKDIEKVKQYLKKACSLGDQMGCVELQNLPGISSSPPSPQNTSTPKLTRRMTISYGEAQNMLIQSTPPIYPPAAKAADISGMVELKIVISTTGSVSEVHVISGPAMLQQAAADAVKTWRYNPYLVNNHPVEVETTVSVQFIL